MSLRETLRKAAGLLVEMPPDENEESGESASGVDKMWAELEAEAKSKTGPPAGDTKTVEQIVRDAPGPNLDQIQFNPASVPTSLPDEGKLDFAGVYRQANLPAAPFSAEQALDMIHSLPPELPMDTRRQTVKVMLDAVGKSIGATPESVVTDASLKLAALTAYVETVTARTAEVVKNAEGKIAALQAQIEDERKSILQAQQLQMQVTQQCAAESHRIDDILEFFSLDVAPSKYAPPPA